MSYASDTTVPVERSRTQIEQTLARAGADAIAFGWSESVATIGFRAHGRHVRFTLALPSLDDMLITPAGRRRSKGDAETARAQRHRALWRALLLVIKAKLEAAESGIESWEEAFLAQTVTPDGSTVAETALPALAVAYETGRMPELFPGADSPKALGR